MSRATCGELIILGDGTAPALWPTALTGRNALFQLPFHPLEFLFGDLAPGIPAFENIER